MLARMTTGRARCASGAQDAAREKKPIPSPWLCARQCRMETATGRATETGRNPKMQTGTGELQKAPQSPCPEKNGRFTLSEAIFSRRQFKWRSVDFIRS